MRRAVRAGTMTMEEVRRRVAGWAGHAAQADRPDLLARLSRRWPFAEQNDNSQNYS